MSKHWLILYIHGWCSAVSQLRNACNELGGEKTFITTYSDSISSTKWLPVFSATTENKSSSNFFRLNNFGQSEELTGDSTLFCVLTKSCKFCGSGWHIAHMCTHCIYYTFDYIGCKSVCFCKYCLFAVFHLLFSGWTLILQRDTPSGLWRLVGSSSCCPCMEWTRLKSKDTSAHAQRRRRSGTWNFKFMQSPQRMNPKFFCAPGWQVHIFGFWIMPWTYYFGLWLFMWKTDINVSLSFTLFLMLIRKILAFKHVKLKKRTW